MGCNYMQFDDVIKYYISMYLTIKNKIDNNINDIYLDYVKLLICDKYNLSKNIKYEIEYINDTIYYNVDKYKYEIIKNKSNYESYFNKSNLSTHISSDEQNNTEKFKKYMKDLNKIDNNKIIKKFINNEYYYNNFIHNSIFNDDDISSDINNLYMDIVDMSATMTNKYNFNDMDFYCNINDINTNIYGDFKYGDTYVQSSHCVYYLSKPKNKKNIKINYNKNCPLLFYHNKYKNITYVIILMGTVFRLDNENEMTYIGNSKYNNVKNYIEYYKQFYKNNTNNLKINSYIPIDVNKYYDKIMNIDKIMINNILNFFVYPIIIDDIIDEYPILHYDNIDKLPKFDTDMAYIGEKLAGDKSIFCMDEKINYNKNGINIISFNVHNFVKICFPYGRDIKHFENFIKSVKFNDIICLQECSLLYDEYPDTIDKLRKGSFNKLYDIMNDHGYEYSVMTNQNYGHNEYLLCNAIFSKIKIKSNISFGLIGNRCIQKITLENGLDIFNTHLEYSANLSNYKYKMPNIDAQINQIYSLIKFSSKFILCGDFNHDIRNNNKFKSLINYVNIASPPSDTYYTGFNRSSVIDFICVSKNIKYSDSKVLKTNISDHYPITVNIL